MMSTGSTHATDRLRELERTVKALNGQLRHMQSEFQQVKAASIRERLWDRWIGPWQSRLYMSAVCNRYIRPNTKVTHDFAHGR
jgi:hypothetical protein